MDKNNEMINSYEEGTQNIQPSLDQELIEETLQCLQKTFMEKNNLERQKAEKKLKELEVNILPHIRSILLGLGSDLKQDIKLSIILYLKNMIRNRLETRSLTTEEVITLVNTFIEVILTTNLNDQLIQNLSLSLTYILNSNYVIQNPNVVVNISSLLNNFLSKKEASGITEIELILSFKPMVMLIQTIISSSGTNSENITDVLAKNFELVDFMITKISNKMKTFSLKDDTPVYLSCVNILRLILDYLFLSLIKLKKLDMLDNIISIYVNKFLIFAMETISNSNMTEFNLILFTGDKEVDSSLNSMKSKSFQLLSFLIQNEGSVIKNQFVIENLSKLVRLSISSLNAIVNEKMEYLSNMNKNNNEYPDNNYDILLFQILLFLSRFLGREPIVTQFTGFVKNFVMSIIFPLLQSTKHENYLMKLEGEEHHNLLVDYIFHHKTKNFKTSASFLLNKLCEKYDGLASFVINFCFELLDFCMNGSIMDSLNKYSILSLAQNPENEGMQKVISGLTPENQIDTAFLILLILHQTVNKNKRFLAMTRLLLETYSDKMFTINSEMIKDKLCLLLGTFLDELYQPDEIEGFYQHLSKIFEFLFAQILNFHNNQGSAYNASYSLCQLLYCKDFVNLTNILIRKIMPNLIQIIKEIEVVLFFDVLVDIILYMDVEDSLISLCKEVTNRILKEIKSPKTKEKNLNMYISKCFHILRTVLEKNKMFMREEEWKSDVEVVIETDALEVTDFEKIIEPVVSYIKKPDKIDFDDEIIYLMINLIENARKITPLCKMIFFSLPNYIIKHEGILEELFTLLNLYISYDEEGYLIQTPENISNMTYIIKTGMEENEENEFSPLFASLLTQAWLQCNKNIPQDCVLELIIYNIKELEGIYSIYQDSIEQLESTFDVYLFSTFLTTIYSGLIYYPLIVLSKLSKLNILSDFVTWTELAITFGFFSTYYSKIIIIGICSILSDQTITSSHADYVKRFLYFAFTLLIKQKNAESKKLKTALKDELECHFIGSDEEENGEDEEDEGPINIMEIKRLNRKMEKMNDNVNYLAKEDKQIQKLINSLKTPLVSSDEYQFFHQTLSNINSFNRELLSGFTNLLNEPQKHMWNELVHTRRIQVNHSGLKLDVPRRTVRIKRSGIETDTATQLNTPNSNLNMDTNL